MLKILVMALCTAGIATGITVGLQSAAQRFPAHYWTLGFLGTVIRSLLVFTAATVIWWRFRQPAEFVVFIFAAVVLQLVGCCGLQLKRDWLHD